MKLTRCSLLFAVVFWCLAGQDTVAVGEPLPQAGDNFSNENLVAWCIVPFDAEKRGPRARAEMLQRLGITRLAYDWRDEHVQSFEEEIIECRRHGIEFFAFWSWHDRLGELIAEYDVHPQIWITSPSPDAPTQQERVEAAANALLPLVEKTRALECKLGLYNHGGWGGEPENLVALCEYLRRRHNADHVGIVYNFHHAHGHLERFAESFRQMQPYLLCVNLNGMADAEEVVAEANKILPISAGRHEARLIRIVRDNGYAGPIGIIDHRGDTDAEASLRENLAGLAEVLRRIAF